MLFRLLFAAVATIALSGCNYFLFYFGERNVQQQDTAFVASQVQPTIDSTLAGAELYILLNNTTIVSRSISEPWKQQFGYFNWDGTLIVNPSKGQLIQGHWTIRGRALCYLIQGGEFCSLVKAADVITRDGRPQSVLYFARENTLEPTVLITDLFPGNVIPASRIAG